MHARRHRYPAGEAVQFYRVDELVDARAHDASSHGLFVHTDAFLPINGVVDIAVALPGTEPLVLPGRVAHCLPPSLAGEVGRASGIGFELLAAAPPATLSRWHAYVRSLGARVAGDAERRRRLLLVSRRERLVERLVNVVQEIALGLSFYDARDAPDAALCAAGVDALVVDGALVDHPAVVELRGRVDAPMLALATDAAHAGRAWRAGAAEVLRFPFGDLQLRAAVQRLEGDVGSPDMSGDLSTIAASSVLTMLEYERRNGVLTLLGPAGSIRIRVAGGLIHGVRVPPGLRPAEGLSLALDYREGRFEFRCDPGDGPGAWHADREPLPDSRPISHVLFEHARRSDEQGRGSD